MPYLNGDAELHRHFLLLLGIFLAYSILEISSYGTKEPLI